MPDQPPTELDVQLGKVVDAIIEVAKSEDAETARFQIEWAVREWGAKAYRSGMARTVEITRKYWREWPIEMPTDGE